MKKRLTLLLAVLFLCIGGVMAQTKVSGTVVSQDDGEPVIGASVVIQGAKTGVVTDVNGRFSLTVPAGKKISVSYIGMTTQVLTPKSTMQIVLVPDGEALDEVSRIPTRDELLARLFGSMQSPIANFARVIKQIAEKDAEAVA